jgi:hypothetical protein
MMNPPLFFGMKQEHRDRIILEKLIDDIPTLFPTPVERDE